MQQDLQITYRHMAASDAIERRVRHEVTHLERLFPRILTCHVTVEAPHHHHHKGGLYRVEVLLRIPAREVVVGRDAPRNHAHEDVYVAIRDAFAAAARRLQDHARRMRGEEKRHEPPMTGRVVRLFPQEGYGFIDTDQGEVYFHRNSVAGDRFAEMEEGREVTLTLADAESEHGAQASTVHVLARHRGGA